jgi:OmpA-OmpF porin, OOP family
MRSHSALMSLIFDFGAEEPAPPPPPPPPQIAPCNSGPYVVVFDWDEADITPEAAAMHPSCLQDTLIEPARYNVSLSLRRNASVLTARGIPSARIASEVFGESQPLGPTKDSVRELQNRPCGSGLLTGLGELDPSQSAMRDKAGMSNFPGLLICP